MNIKKQRNNHHRVAKEAGGTNHYDNIAKMLVLEHRALHLLFDNMPPHQQLEEVIRLAGKALSPEFTASIREVINSYELEDIYNKKC
jgi:hypothetical protein